MANYIIKSHNILSASHEELIWSVWTVLFFPSPGNGWGSRTHL